MHSQQELQAIYAQRFANRERSRDYVWQVLTRHFFQRWVRPGDTVVDLGAGYCEFVNNIRAQRKIAVDLNPATVQKAAAGVEVMSCDVSSIWPIEDASVDVVFTSNLFEHLASKQEFMRCLAQIYRVLRPNGRLVALGPNIRFCFDVYWDFLDHHLPLSDRSIVEATEIAGLKTQTVITRFLPYSMHGALPIRVELVRLYLMLPILWRFFGKQFLVVATK